MCIDCKGSKLGLVDLGGSPPVHVMASMTNQESHNQPPAAPVVLCKRKDFLDTDEAAKSHPNRTYYYRKEADIAKVIDTCTKKLAANPTDATTIAIRGASHMKKMEWAQAVDDFGQVLKLSPTDANAYYKYIAIHSTTECVTEASCYNKQGDFSRAIEDYHFALMKDEQVSNKTKQAKPVTKPPAPVSVASKHLPAENSIASLRRNGGSVPSSMTLGVDVYTKLRERELLDAMTSQLQ
ncbi:hypothetical protein DYB30_005317 [Aphanomyces astaci]|uniref:Uncharacterized protein n=1 Tax=Aphanomyces astaci TaxID=112090 RepID=A0A397DQX7_APHAT|nr:hypothetical protein DYB30_005317 [Aphanomyces astaci]